MAEYRPIPHSAPQLGREEIEAAERVLKSGQLAQGPEVAAFEEECAAFAGRNYAVAVNSGTAALHLGLLALGIRAGATVAIPSYVCTALLNAVGYTGATARLLDIGSDFNMLVPDALTDAAIVTHLFGKPGKLPANARIIEDLAQALGAACGTSGAIAVASFYATKLMTTGGEGGMVLTDDASIAEFVRDRRDYDNREDYRTRYNYKMTDLAAAIGRAQLVKLPGWIQRRREIAAEYQRAFSELPLTCPDAVNHIFFRYVVLTDRREALQHHLNAAGIGARRPVYKPLHRYDLTNARVHLASAYPGADRAHAEALSLPLNPGMASTDIKHMVNSVRGFFSG